MDQDKLKETIKSGQFDKESLSLATDLIRERLTQGGSVSLGKVGDLGIEHIPTVVETRDDGTVEIFPPKNKVRLSK